MKKGDRAEDSINIIVHIGDTFWNKYQEENERK